jgi:hypothetical protein
MLTTDQMAVLLKKETLKLEDLLLIEDHLLSIAKIEQEYTDLPEDIVKNLNNDVELILELLKNHRKKTQFRLLTNDE